MNKTTYAGLALLTQMLLASTALAQVSDYVGLIHGDWHDAANWSNGVPDATTYVTIDGDGPWISAPAYYASLAVGSPWGSRLSIGDILYGTSAVIGMSGSTGYIDVLGSGANWTNTGNLAIIQGELLVSDGGTAHSHVVRMQDGSIRVGDSPNQVNVGANATLQMDNLFVGGNGTVSVANGPITVAGMVTVGRSGAIEVAEALFGGDAGLEGRLEINGATNASLTSSVDLALGVYGRGTLRVNNGLLNTYETRLAVESGSFGSIALNGANATWTASGTTLLGRSGDGVLSVQNGALADIKGLSMASAGGVGVVTVEGNGSRLLADGNITFGAPGHSFLNIYDGGYVEANQVMTGGGPPGSLGTGTLRLRGASSKLVANKVSLQTGTIQLGGQLNDTPDAAGTLDANIELGDSAMVVLNHTGSNYVLASNITYLNQTGPTLAGIRQQAGVSRLTGDGRQLKGREVLVTGGSLLVDNHLGGNFNVTGGILGGSGIVGYDFAGRTTDEITIGNGGTLAPGDGVGMLTAQGNVTFGAGSTFAVQIASNGSSDLLDVSGTVSANGGTLRVSGTGGALTGGTQYTVLTANGGLSGNFALANDLAFFTPTLSQVGNDLLVVLGRNGTSLVDLAETGEQKGIAEAIEQLGPGNEVYDAFMNQNKGDVPGALTMVGSGPITPGHPVTFNWTDSFSSTLGGTNFGGDGASPSTLAYAPVPATRAVAAIADVTPQPLSQGAAWLAPMAGFGRVDVDAGTASWLSGGLAGGYDYRTSLSTADVLAGLALGYQRTHVETGDAGELSANSGMIGAYGALRQDRLSLRGALYYGASAVEAERRIVFPGVDRTAEADYWGHAGGLSAQVSYAMPVAETTFVSPLAGVDASVMHRQAYTETGAGAFNLSSDAQTWWQIAPGLGAEVTSLFALEDGVVTTRASAKVQQALLTQPGQDLTFAGTNAGFTLDAVDTGRTKAVMAAGVDYSFGAISLFADYQGSFSSGQHQHGVRLGAKGAF